MAFEMMGRLMGPMNGDDDFVEITPGYGKDICAKLKAVRIDIKDINPKIYSKYTGTDNSLVLENLEKLIARVGKEKLHIRLPQIPGYNTLKEVSASADYLRKHYNIEPEIFKYIQI